MDSRFPAGALVQASPTFQQVGEWLVADITFGFNIEERVGTKNTRFWISAQPESHTLVAFPLVDHPTTEPPYGARTSDQIALAMRDAYSIYVKATQQSLELE